MSALELKVPPAAQVLILGAGMWCASALVPSLAFALPGRYAFAIAFAGAGLMLGSAGVAAFRKAKTTVNPTKPGTASSLVTSGVYRLSRNPMYAGLLFLLGGWAIFLSNGVAFVFLPVFIAYMNRFQIMPEERALSAKFGNEFAAYKQSVRRWL